LLLLVLLFRCSMLSDVEASEKGAAELHSCLTVYMTFNRV
jgi:hypothetical protein